MIQEISEYEYLGNGLDKMNSNMAELNVRIDQLFSQKEQWSKATSIVNSIVYDLNNLSNTVHANSGFWRQSTNLIYNTQVYWAEPIMIVYGQTFTYAANYLEIEDWLNQYFPIEDFDDNQILRCDFLCKNYDDKIVANSQLPTFDPFKAEAKALEYATTTRKVFDFLGFKNQLNAIISLINFLLYKNNNQEFVIDSIKNLDHYSSFVLYDENFDRFYSHKLSSSFNQIDLKFFDSYITQYNTVYALYEATDLSVIPTSALNFFELKDVSITNSGHFFYKKLYNQWSYYPYKTIDFCANDLCSDCFDVLDLNKLYPEKRQYCFQGVSYILSEVCDPESPVEPYGESLSFMEAEPYDTLSNLIS